MVVKAGQAAVQVQDAFHVPLLELCLGSGGFEFCAYVDRLHTGSPA